MTRHSRMSRQDIQAWREECWPFLGRCVICRRKNIPVRNRVSDHCHRTGMTRAILCRACNGFVGSIETGSLDDAAMFSLMRRKGVPATIIPEHLRRMRTYVEFWCLQADENELLLQQYGDIITPQRTAAWLRASCAATLRYRRWLRRTYGLRTWQGACWTGLGWHVHMLARNTHRLIASGRGITALPERESIPGLAQ